MWEDIKLYLGETGCKSVDCTEVTQDNVSQCHLYLWGWTDNVTNKVHKLSIGNSCTLSFKFVAHINYFKTVMDVHDSIQGGEFLNKSVSSA